MFLCGCIGSERRDALRDYLRKHVPWVNLFYAESAWEQIASGGIDHGALKMEADLAALADLVIIVVESPGTFAELGAFSLSGSVSRLFLTTYTPIDKFLDLGV